MGRMYWMSENVRVSWWTFMVFMFMAVVLALNNVYSSLMTGWGGGGSIVAVFIVLLLLSRRQSNIYLLNLGQTMASAGGSVGFTTSTIAAIYLVDTEFRPSVIALTFLIVSLSWLGVTVAVPFRRFMVKKFWPEAVAVAVALREVTSRDPAVRRRARRLMGTGGVISGILTLPTKLALRAGEGPIWKELSFSEKIKVNLDPLLFGIGMVVGPRIGLGMVIGAVFTTFLFVPQLAGVGLEEGVIKQYVLWLAIGLLTIPAFVDPVLMYLFRKEEEVPPGFDSRAEGLEDRLTAKEKLVLSLFGTLAAVITIITMYTMFGVSSWLTLLALVLSGPACVLLGQVAATTGINPIRLVAIIFMVFFGALISKMPLALLALAAVAGATGATAVDLMQDLRVGHLINARPKRQLKFQYLGVVVGGLPAVLFMNLIVFQFGIGEGKMFPAPGCQAWAGLAQALSGASSMSSGIWITFIVASIVGTVIAFFANWPRTSKYVPSVFGMGLAPLLPMSMSLAIFLGGVARLVATVFGISDEQQKERRLKGVYLVGTAVFVAAGFMGILAVILIATGVFYLPVD